RLAAVVGNINGIAEHIYPILIFGIDANLAVVHGPRIDRVHPPPRLAAIIGAKYTAILHGLRTSVRSRVSSAPAAGTSSRARGLNNCVNNVGIALRNIKTDAAYGTRRQRLS